MVCNIIWLYWHVIKWHCWFSYLLLNILWPILYLLLIISNSWIELIKLIYLLLITIEVHIIINFFIFDISWRKAIPLFYYRINFRAFYFSNILIRSHSKWFWLTCWNRSFNYIGIRRLHHLILHSRHRKRFIISVNKGAIFLSFFCRKKLFHLVHE